MRRAHRLTEDGDGPTQLAALAEAAGYAIGVSTARRLLTPPWTGAGRGFEGWQLSNNLAEIKRLRARLGVLEAKATAIEAADDAPAPVERAGVQLIEDVAEDRLRLVFDGKPAPAVIADLKSRGFRWSPRAGAWHRQLNNNARHAADAILSRIEQAAA